MATVDLKVRQGKKIKEGFLTEFCFDSAKQKLALLSALSSISLQLLMLKL